MTSFTAIQNSILTGSLLGDGCIVRGKHANAYFSKKQAERRYDYLKWHFYSMMPWSSRVTRGITKAYGKEYGNAVYCTKRHEYFNNIRDKWYVDNKKVIPDDIKLDNLSLTIWFCDDGCNCVKNRSCSFATNCFSEKECDILRRAILRDFGIDTFFYNGSIFVRCEFYEKFINIVASEMKWECFQYKLAYRDSKRKNINDACAKKICELWNGGETYKDIVDELNVSYNTVVNVIKGRSKLSLNLKIPSQEMNVRNKSGVKGVCWFSAKNKWLAFYGKKNLGTFKTKEEAALVRKVFVESL